MSDEEVLDVFMFMSFAHCLRFTPKERNTAILKD
jgi:hypothetical protein